MKDCKIQLCETCGCFVFIGKTMKCANGHEIDISKLKRDEVVAFYRMMIEAVNDDKVVVNFNDKIIKKWSLSSLSYIKNKAWKQIADQEKSNNLVFDI